MSLTNTDLDARLKHVPGFRGCRMRDGLRGARPGLYVVNLDGGQGKGTHWCFLELRGNGPSFWVDPFGCPPPQSVKDAVRGPLRYSQAVLQPEWSNDCGRFCAHFVMACGKYNRSPESVIRDFSAAVNDNDKKVVAEYAQLRRA